MKGVHSNSILGLALGTFDVFGQTGPPILGGPPFGC